MLRDKFKRRDYLTKFRGGLRDNYMTQIGPGAQYNGLLTPDLT